MTQISRTLPYSTQGRPSQGPTRGLIQPFGIVPFWKDRYALLLFVGIFGMCAIGLGLGPVSSIMLQLRWGLLGVLALASLPFLDEFRSSQLTREHRWTAALIVIGLASSVYSVMPWYSFQRAGSFVLLWSCLFVGAWCWLRRRKNVLVGVDLLYALVVVVTLISAFRTGSESIVEREYRATGAFGKATGAGTFAAISIPIVLWKLGYCSGWSRLIGAGVLIVQAYLLFFSGARAALVAAAIALPFLVWRQYRQFRALVLVAYMFMVVAFASNSLFEYLPDYVIREESIYNLTGRLERYEALWHVWQEQPVVGHGYGVGRFMIAKDPEALAIYLSSSEMSPREAQWLDTANSSGQPVEIQPHSDHIERLVETGLLGYTCFAAFLALLLARIPKAISRPRSQLSDLVCCLLASMWVLFVDSFVHSSLFAVGNVTSMLTWFLIVLLMVSDDAQNGLEGERARLNYASNKGDTWR